jgi:hypothetical protein
MSFVSMRFVGKHSDRNCFSEARGQHDVLLRVLLVYQYRMEDQRWVGEKARIVKALYTTSVRILHLHERKDRE